VIHVIVYTRLPISSIAIKLLMLYIPLSISSYVPFYLFRLRFDVSLYPFSFPTFIRLFIKLREWSLKTVTNVIIITAIIYNYKLLILLLYIIIIIKYSQLSRALSSITIFTLICWTALQNVKYQKRSKFIRSTRWLFKLPFSICWKLLAALK